MSFVNKTPHTYSQFINTYESCPDAIVGLQGICQPDENRQCYYYTCIMNVVN
jgi:hypothetical protein